MSLQDKLLRVNAPIAYQPTAKSAMRLSGDPSQQEKALQLGACTEHIHDHPRTRRKLRTVIITSLGLAVLGIYTFVFFACLDTAGDETGGDISFWRRQYPGNGYDQGTFVHNSLWIIVLVLGLAACIILAVMLSAWCCRGAFENPLCCPCYLCACCGGLVCLECISCGICASQ